jgi:hypothetical protein
LKYRYIATYDEIIDPVSVIQFSVVGKSIFCYQYRWIVVFLSYPVEELPETPWNHLQIFFMIRRTAYDYICKARK